MKMASEMTSMATVLRTALVAAAETAPTKAETMTTYNGTLGGSYGDDRNGNMYNVVIMVPLSFLSTSKYFLCFYASYFLTTNK